MSCYKQSLCNNVFKNRAGIKIEKSELELKF